jgi:hypothetical protein
MLVGLTKSLRIMQRRSTVTNATVALTIPSAEVPRCAAHVAVHKQHSCVAARWLAHHCSTLASAALLSALSVAELLIYQCLSNLSRTLAVRFRKKW